MRRLPARFLLNYSAMELWQHITGQFILVMDDGEEIPTNHVETCYSSYAWDFHRAYPETPLLTEHHIRGILRWDKDHYPERLSISADLKLIGNCMMSVYDTYKANGKPIDRVLLWKMAYDVDNLQYCDFPRYADRYVSTIDLLHFHEAMDEPEIYAANQAVQRGEIHVNEVYKIIDKVFKDKSRLKNNPVAKEYRSKLLKETQVHQNIGPRGNPTDMDSRIFGHTILRGYVEGIRAIADSAIETRSAARASYYAAESLRMSEYFSRKLQFVSQNVQRLHHDCDCGSTQYLEWRLRPMKKDERGEVVRASDLELLNGKYYLDEATNSLKMLTPLDFHLIGQKIKLRSVLYCAHPDSAGVCSTCLGEMAFSIPPDANLGQYSATNMAEQATQALLSAKHLERSMALEDLDIQEKDRPYITAGKDNSSYLLNKALEDKDVSIILLKDQADNLNDIKTVDEIEHHPENHYTELSGLNIEVTEVTDLQEVMNHPKVKALPTSRIKRVDIGTKGSREGSLSYAFLEYIKENGYTMVSSSSSNQRIQGQRGQDCYKINMDQWDYDEPIIVLPAKHFNNSDHVEQVAKMLESRVAEQRARARTESVTGMIEALFDFVNRKLSVNLAYLEVILYATMVVSVDENDYALPKPWTTSQPSVLSMTMRGRSQSVNFAFEKQYEALIDTASYIYTNRFDHPFDGIYTPTQVFGTVPS